MIDEQTARNFWNNKLVIINYFKTAELTVIGKITWVNKKLIIIANTEGTLKVIWLKEIVSIREANIAKLMKAGRTQESEE